MSDRALIQATSELVREFRHTNQPSDRVMSGFFRGRKFLGARDRRFIGDTFYHLLRHLRRIDRSLATALENAPLSNWLSRATGFPCDEIPNSLVWANPGPPARRLTAEDKWIESMRVSLAANDMNPGFLAENIPELASLWPLKPPPHDQGTPDKPSKYPFGQEFVVHAMKRAGEVMVELSSEPRRMRWPIKHSFSEWMWGLLGYGIAPDELEASVKAFNQPGKNCLRVNTLKISADDYAAKVTEAGVEFERSKLATNGLVFAERLARGRLPGEQDGWAEFQDEGSQFLSEVIAPQAGMTVIDACAGAGGKTLHFAALMKNQGRILVHEPSDARRENLRERATTAGITITERLDSPKVAPKEAADILLIDAPCTGTGTMRRSPELKFRVIRDTLTQRVATQQQILEEWCETVKPGGVLAYVTCSILNEENGMQVDRFLSGHSHFKRLNLGGRKGVGADMVTRAGDIQLMPHRHGCDGFYLALLERIP